MTTRADVTTPLHLAASKAETTDVGAHGGPKGPVVFLASPYTNDDTDMERERFEQVVRVAGVLYAHGVRAFSPIAHSHPIYVAAGGRESPFAADWQTWASFNDTILVNACDELWIAEMPGWNRSAGINHEAAVALDHGMLIRVVLDDGMTITEPLAV